AVHGVGLIARRGQRFLVAFALGDIGVNDDHSAAGQRIVAYLQDAAVRARSFEGIVSFGICHELLQLGLGVDVSILAVLRKQAHIVVIVLLASQECLGDVQHLDKLPVP